MEAFLRVGLIAGVAATATVWSLQKVLPTTRFWLGIAGLSLLLIGFVTFDYIGAIRYEGSVFGVAVAFLAPLLVAALVWRSELPDQVGAPSPRVSVRFSLVVPRSGARSSPMCGGD